jgi:hypothetical protein
MAHHESFDLQQQPGPSDFSVSMQHSMLYPPANEGTESPGLLVPSVLVSVNNDADASTQREDPSGSASGMQTKPPSENEAFEDVVTVHGGSANHSVHSSVGSIAIRVRIPETPATRSEISMNSPVRRITFGDMPPYSEEKEPEEPVETWDQSVIIPDRNRVSRGSPVRRITFGDMALEPEQKEPEEPAVTIPNHNRVEPDSPVRSVTFGDLGAPNSSTPGPSKPTVPIQAPVPTLAPVPVVRRVIEGNRIPTLADEWVPQGYQEGRIHHALFQQSTNMHRNASQASTVASMPQNDPTEMPFLRQLEEMSRAKAQSNQEQIQSQRNQGDVRLDPDFSGTVIRRRPRAHGRIKSWMAANNRYTDTQAPPYLEAPQPYVHKTYQPLPVSEPLEAPGPSKPKSNKKRKNKQSKNRTNLDSQPSTRSTTPFPYLNPVPTPAPPPAPITRPQTPATVQHVEDSNLYDATPPRRDHKGKGKDEATTTKPTTTVTNGPTVVEPEQAVPDLIFHPTTSTSTSTNTETTNTRPHTPAPSTVIPSGSSKNNDAEQVDEYDLYNATPKRDRNGKGKGKDVSGGGVGGVGVSGGVGVGAEQERDHASGDGQT